MSSTPSNADARERRLLDAWRDRRDEAAFTELVERLTPLAGSICRRILNRFPGEVDDAVQETFFALARDAARIAGAPGAWIRTCAATTALGMLRRRRPELHQLVVAETLSAGPDSDPETGDEDLDRLERCLARLDEDQRQTIIRHFILGETQAGIAQSDGASAAAIQRRLAGALRQLRGALRPEQALCPAA